MDVGATDAGVRGKSSVERSHLNEAGTLGGIADDHKAVIDDIEVIDLESKYKVEKTLGRGGMGEVFLAVDTRLGRKVAIKQILGDAARSKIAVSRFLTEAKSIAAIGDHPNIIQLYEFGRTKNGPFLIMEYVEGGNLSNHCRERALPLEEAIDLTCQLCDGLGRAHDQGIIHRDIKPANVLLTKDGVPKLTDFGLAKTDVSNHQMTVIGAVLGTPDFMPPEQRRNAAEVDARSDLWSLAATMYQMVTGRSPKIIRFRDVPAELEDVLGTALEEQKKDRFQSAKEFGDALRSVAGDRVSAKKPRLILGKLQEGQCKACGTITGDLTKKFCRNRDCGSSLRVDCLQCNVSIPVWDDVCGECGGNQPKILELRREGLEELKAQAESLLSEMSFNDAIQLAKQVESEVHPDLSDLSEWARHFQESVETERKHQTEIAEQHFADAKKHVEAFDYDSAIHSLGSIRDKFRSGPVESLYVESQRKKKESESLITEIQKAFGNKNFEGLLPKIERAIELCGDREDLKGLSQQVRDAQAIASRRRELEALKMKAESLFSEVVLDEAMEVAWKIGSEKHPSFADLCEWSKDFQQSVEAEHNRRTQINAQHVSNAQRYLKAFDYGSALRSIKSIHRQFRDETTDSLYQEAKQKKEESESLLREIQKAVKNKSFEDLVPKVERAIELLGDRVDLARLAHQLLSKKRQDLESLKSKAESLFSAVVLDEALEIAWKIESETHSSFADLRQWSKDFQQSVDNEYERQVEITSQHVSNAQRYLKAFDYGSALRSIKSIHRQFRDETTDSLYLEAKQKKEESESLINEIEKAIDGKRFKGLLAKVERAIKLCGDREDLKGLVEPLREQDQRHKERVSRRVHIFRKAAEARSDGVLDIKEANHIAYLIRTYCKTFPKDDELLTLEKKCYLRLAGVPKITNSWSQITFDVTQALVEFKGSLYLNGLSSITPEIAELLAKNQQDLHLDGLVSITAEVAEILVKEQRNLHLNGLASLSPEIAEILMKNRGDLLLDGLSSVDSSIVKFFQNHHGRLRLDGLSFISEETAEGLAKHQGVLGLNGLSSITPGVASRLVKHQGGLGLNGLSSMTPEVARQLACHRGGLGLNGLSSMTPEVAREFARHQGVLGLNGLSKITLGIARSLAKNKGVVFLNGLSSCRCVSKAQKFI